MATNVTSAAVPAYAADDAIHTAFAARRSEFEATYDTEMTAMRRTATSPGSTPASG